MVRLWVVRTCRVGIVVVVVRCVWAGVALLVVEWYVAVGVVSWWMSLLLSGASCYLEYLLMYLFRGSFQPNSGVF
jgi:hypothetical protein